ncbi:MAG TPA: glycosyltransferase, partial [Thermoplasmata archaeon]|nr:glycosyltransferase [Thermoplasmata archaeon]
MAGICHVVVLNWNGRDSIRQCLRSVLHQTYAAYRVVVVDNASTDGSLDIIRDEFSEVTLVPLPENLHFARGTNAGLREALRDPECAFIGTLNNDTRVDPEWLAELVRMAGARVGMVASKMVFIDRPNVLNSTGVSIGPDGSAMDRGWNSVDEGQFDQAVDVFGPS